MMNSLFFGTSLIVAFLGGIIALFAPCCITFLLPSYLASILNTRVKILWGTFLFALGIATLMVPVTIGFWSIVLFFQRWHTPVYLAGGAFMIVLGLLAWFRIKLPMPTLAPRATDAPATSWSLYVLGLFSGLTSVCCAPVLAGALTLGALAPSFVQSFIIGLTYVAGIVFPLFLASFVLEASALKRMRLALMKPVTINIGAKTIERSVGDLFSGLIFIGMGVFTIALALLGKIAMPTETSRLGQITGSYVVAIGQWIRHYAFLDILFGLTILIFFVILFRRARRSLKNSTQSTKR